MKNIRTRANKIPALNVIDKTVVRYICIVELGLNSIKTQCFWCLHISVFLNVGTVSTHFHFS